MNKKNSIVDSFPSIYPLELGENTMYSFAGVGGARIPANF